MNGCFRNGYRSTDHETYAPARALLTDELIGFIEKIQSRPWARLAKCAARSRASLFIRPMVTAGSSIGGCGRFTAATGKS